MSLHFNYEYARTANLFLTDGQHVDTGHWQAMKDVPQTKTVELQNYVFTYQVPNYRETLQMEVEPNLPWAEEHFQERVGREPVNPPPSHVNWPWAGHNYKHMEKNKFSHTYPERIWPKECGDWKPFGLMDPDPDDVGYPHGIRYRYGDLDDVLNLLAREPYTRQAYLPIWFPEDTGAHHGGRVPCTLGYHFMLRAGKLHCFYPIRSCDFIRHFRDDIYLAARLMQWVIDEMQNTRNTVSKDEGFDWDSVVPGTLTLHAHSFHVFEGDLPKLRREYGG